MGIFIKNSRSIINILFISAIFFRVINASTTGSKNETFNFNDKNNDFVIEEKAQQVMELFTGFVENFPVNDVAIVLSNFINSGNDIKIIMHSIIKNENFARILGFFKIHLEKSDVIRELGRKFAEHPAMRIDGAAKEAFFKELTSIDLLDMDISTLSKFLFNSKKLEGVFKIHGLAMKIMQMDKEFSTFVNYFTHNRRLLGEAVSHLVDEIQKNEMLPNIANLGIIKILSNLIEKGFNTSAKYVIFGRYYQALDGKLSSDLIENFIEELINETDSELMYLENNEKLVDFMDYITNEEVSELLEDAWQKASFQGKDFLVRDEL